MGIVIALLFLIALGLGLSLAAVCLGLMRPRFSPLFWLLELGGTAACLGLAFWLMGHLSGPGAFRPWLFLAACAGLSPALVSLAACRLFPRRG